MLVLSREVNEQIVINENIVITITDVKRCGGKFKVRIGIDAPPDIPVDRLEIHESKMAAKAV